MFSVVNIIDAESTQGELVERTSFPLWQDVVSQEAWKAMGGSKDDIYIYRTDGTLSKHYPIADGELVLSSEAWPNNEGHERLKAAIELAIAESAAQAPAVETPTEASGEAPKEAPATAPSEGELGSDESDSPTAAPAEGLSGSETSAAHRSQIALAAVAVIMGQLLRML